MFSLVTQATIYSFRHVVPRLEPSEAPSVHVRLHYTGTDKTTTRSLSVSPVSKLDNRDTDYYLSILHPKNLEGYEILPARISYMTHE